MPDTSTALSPSADQRGAAIIVAMMTLALVAVIVSAIIAEWGAATAALVGHHDHAQARLLARAGVDWSRNILADDAKTSSIDYVGETWSVRVPPTPAEEGEIGGEIDDLSGRFDVNSLARPGATDARQAAAYGRLLGLLGFADNEVAAMVAALADGPLADIDELALRRGYDGGRMVRLGPFVTAAPVAAPVNVNTAPPEVLAALLPGLSLDAARAIVGERQQRPFRDLGDFAARSGRPDAGTQAFSVSSRYFVTTVRARYGEALVQMRAMLDRGTTWPEILWQKLT